MVGIMNMSLKDEDQPFKYVNKILGACLALSAIFLLSVPVGRNLFRLPTSLSSINSEAKDELERVLESASIMESKTLIITVVNQAYAHENGILDLFLQSLSMGEETQHLVNHLLVVAVDQAALDRCHKLRLLCFQLPTNGVDFSGEEVYMSTEFISMMWRRTLFLIDVLRRGYNFIFTDTDVIWLKNPFPRLGNLAKADLQISCDRFNGQPWDISNPINTGFYFINSNNKTISLFQQWYSARNSTPGMKEQDVLQDMVWKNVTNKMELKVRFLPTNLFGGFCEHSNNLTEVVTLHANCCRTIGAKIEDLGVVLKTYKMLKDDGFTNATSLPTTWIEHKACGRSWMT